MSDQTPKGIADWMQLIQASISPPPQPEVASERDIIHRAAALINEDGLTPQERIQAIEENEYEAHLQLRYDEGAEEGKLEGLLEGEQKGKLEVARNMLASGIPPSDVAKFTGLSLDDLAALD
jgi:predicted transposase/invertase (TIGR01784 family)